MRFWKRLNKAYTGKTQVLGGNNVSTQSPPIGVIPASTFERLLIALLYIAAAALALLSLLGTFYGLRQMEAVLVPPWQMVFDAIRNPAALVAGFIVQAVLSIMQYGARARAHNDPRFWIVYLVALAISVYYNCQAYFIPLTMDLGLNEIIAFLLILGGDVLPEFVIIKK